MFYIWSQIYRTFMCGFTLISSRGMPSTGVMGSFSAWITKQEELIRAVKLGMLYHEMQTIISENKKYLNLNYKLSYLACE